MKSDEILQILTRFHRDVVLPDVQRIVEDAIDGAVTPLRREMLAGFDAIYRRFDRLEG